MKSLESLARKYSACFYLFLTSLLVISLITYLPRGSPPNSSNDNDSDEIVESKVEPRGPKNVFFIETRGPEDRTARLSARQLCSIESASRMNPDWNVFVYLMDVDFFEPGPLWDVLVSLENVHVKHINAKSYTKDTPGEGVCDNVLTAKEEFFPAHVSDLLRYVMLYKHAGVYVDGDYISKFSLSEVGLSFAAVEKDSPKLDLGTAIFSFGSDPTGRKMAKMVLEDFATNYYSDDFPQSLAPFRRSIKKICHGKSKLKEATIGNCDGFRVYPPEFFYPVSFDNYTYFFEEEYLDLVMEKVEGAFGVHIWNHFSYENGLDLDKNSKIALNEIAKRYCPETFGSTDKM